MEVYKSYPLLSADEIQKIESKLEVTLPSDYVEFLKNVNAASIKAYYFKGIECGNYFGGFLAQQMDLSHSMVNLNYGLARAGNEEEFVTGKDYIWFASDHAGSLILMSMLEKSHGKIYYLRQDLTYSEGLRLITHSFTDFINLLTEYENHVEERN